MPIHVASSYLSGLFALDALPVLLSCVVAVIFLKRWSGGVDLITRLDRAAEQAQDESEGFGGKRDKPRDLHGTVAIVVGGFTSQGLLVCSQLSALGAQLILLTPSMRSERIVQLVHLLRDGTSNPLIYAEECDVTSIASIEAFAAQWNLGDGAERLMSGQSTEFAGGTGSLANVGLTSAASKKQGTVSEGQADKTGVAPRRIDSIVFLPLDETRSTIQGSTRFTQEQIESSQSEIVGRFHLVNLLLPSLLLLPPSRDIRIVSLLSPWYAAGAHTFEVEKIGAQDSSYFTSTSPWIKDGRQSLLWLALSRELQRRIQLMTEADQRPRTKLPGIDDEGNVTGDAMLANVNLINVCAGFERGRDVLDYLLPQSELPMTSSEHGIETNVTSANDITKPAGKDKELKAMIDPRLKNRRKADKTDKLLDGDRTAKVRQQLQQIYPTQASSLFDRMGNFVRYLLVFLFWPFAWLLCKSSRRTSESVTWATVAPIHSSKIFNPAMNALAVVPGELHREGRVIRPPLPDQLLPGKSTDRLWSKVEQTAKRAFSFSSSS